VAGAAATRSPIPAACPERNLLVYVCMGRSVWCIGLAACFCFGSMGRAANLVYSQAEFLAQAQDVVVEDFEDEPNSGTPDGGGVSQIAFDGFTASAGMPAVKVFDTPQFGNDNTTPGGAKYLSFDTDVGSVAADGTLTFDSGVYAAGFFLIGMDEPRPITVEVDGVHYPFDPTGFDGVGYIGVLSNTPIGSLTIHPAAGDSLWSVDDVAMGRSSSLQRFDVFFDQASYLAAAGTVVVEDFEDEANSGTPDAGGLDVLGFDDFTATASLPALKVFDAPQFGNDNTTPGGAKYLAVDTDVGSLGADATLTFHEPAAGVGVVLIDVDIGDRSVRVPGFEYPIHVTAPGGRTYFGVLANPPLAAVELLSHPNDSIWSIDDVAVVPASPPVPTLPRPLHVAFGALLIAVAVWLSRHRTRRGSPTRSCGSPGGSRSGARGR
jgi:hypothetical protein